MKKNIVLFFIIVATCNLLKAQIFSTFRDSIVKENLEKDIMFLCDSRLSGREIASTGEKTCSILTIDFNTVFSAARSV